MYSPDGELFETNYRLTHAISRAISAQIQQYHLKSFTILGEFPWKKLRLACHVLHLKDRLHRRFELIPQPLFRSLLRWRLMSQVAETACGIRASMNARKKHLGLAESLTHLVMAT